MISPIPAHFLQIFVPPRVKSIFFHLEPGWGSRLHWPVEYGRSDAMQLPNLGQKNDSFILPPPPHHPQYSLCCEEVQSSSQWEDIWTDQHGLELKPSANNQYQLPEIWIKQPLEDPSPRHCRTEISFPDMSCLKFWPTVSVNLINNSFISVSFGVICDVAVVIARQSLRRCTSKEFIVQCWK